MYTVHKDIYFVTTSSKLILVDKMVRGVRKKSNDHLEGIILEPA